MAAININTERFHQLMECEGLVLVDYWAPGCTYCRRIGPAYDKIADEYANSMVVSKINIDEEAILANQEEIEVIPTLVLYRKGEAIGSIVAPESKAMIEDFIRESLGQ